MNLCTWLSTALLLQAGLLAIGDSASAQQPDTNRFSIHQSQSAYHQWDDLKIDSTHKEFLKGSEYARMGKLRSATREFKKGKDHNASYSLFDLGMIAFVQGRYRLALSYFRASFRIEKDPKCKEKIEDTKRLIREHESINQKKKGS